MSELKSLALQFHADAKKVLSRKKILVQFEEVTRGARHLSLGYKLGKSEQLLGALALSEPLALKSGVESVFMMRRAGILWIQYSLPSQLAISYKFADVKPGSVGVSDDNRQVLFVPESAYTVANHNTMTSVVGEPGSGKTTCICTILLSLIKRNPNIKYVITDTKSELGAFDNIVQLERPIARTRQAQSEAIAAVEQEAIHRANNNIKSSDNLLVLVVDEPYQLTPTDYKKLTLILGMGRSLYVWVIMGTQNPQEGSFKKLYPFLSNRFSGKVAPGESYKSLKVAMLKADALGGNGDFIRVDKFNPLRFQVPLITDSDFSGLVRASPHATVAQPIPQTINYDLVGRVAPPPAPMPPGRPVKVAINPDVLAVYHWHHIAEKKLEASIADKMFGFSELYGDRYYPHRKYKETAMRYCKIFNTYSKLRRFNPCKKTTV